jgi:putative membrane protein insertion efficiency factor
MKRKATSLLNTILIGMLTLYQKVLSPHFPPSCRYTPTCSQYAVEALRKYGPLKGVYLALRRIVRCTPFHRGGYDPVR